MEKGQKACPRPGGRSARVQAAVHRAVRELRDEGGREALTVPAIAARAGVTPSTIYRRWGDLARLLSDVALENLHADGEPRDTGSLSNDLDAWLTQYVDEMSAALGRMMLRDVVAAATPLGEGNCAALIRRQFDIINARAAKRGERTIASETLVDQVVAPLIYRILFADETPSPDFARSLLDRALREASLRRNDRVPDAESKGNVAP